jgi:SAM-dependent methyltransferase
VAPRIPLPSIPVPERVSRARTRALASTRRAGVRALMRAAQVPVVRPVAELGMRTLFDSFAGDWERIREDPTYRTGFVEAIGHLPHGFRPRRALDVACGTGLASRMLLERWPGLRLDGIDISPRMVGAARELVPEASFVVGSVHHLPWADGEFDLVTLLDGLLDPAELLRVLHRKGRLLVVYSRGGTTPIARPLDEVSREFEELGGICTPHVDGAAHVLVVRRRR